MIVTILILAILVLLYVIYNLLKKVEKYEERSLNRTDDVEMILSIFNSLKSKMEEIDNKKMFESDDEVGTAFEMLNGVIADASKLLDTYILENDGSSSSR